MGTGYRYTIKTLWGLAKSKELGLTEEELHLLVARETGKDSCLLYTSDAADE